MLDPILQILVQNGYIDDEGAKDIQDLSKTEAKPIRQLVIDQGILTEDDLLACMAAYQDTEAIDLGAMTIETEVTEAIPASTARIYNVFPVAADDMSVTLATFDLVDPRISDEMLFTLSKEVKFVFAREKDVMDRISQYYGDANDSVADMIKSLGEDLGNEDGLSGANSNDIASMENAANSNAIIKFVNLVLYQGVVDRAADIHVEPFEHDFKIRYRVDGALYEMKAPDVKMAPAIISRIKILANLNIAERRIPQDGRIALTVAGKPVDLRVSCLPTVHGESVVMRILDQSATSLDLENVGLPECRASMASSSVISVVRLVLDRVLGHVRGGTAIELDTVARQHTEDRRPTLVAADPPDVFDGMARTVHVDDHLFAVLPEG